MHLATQTRGEIVKLGLHEARQTRRRSWQVAGSLLVILLATACAVLPATAAAKPSAPKIINGTDITGGNFTTRYQSLVALHRAGMTAVDGQYCGGTRIDDNLVLTAAHCVTDLDNGFAITDPGEIEVSGGTEMLSTMTFNSTVSAVYVHPYYSSNPSTINDVAVLRLDTADAVAAHQATPVGAGETALWGNGAGIAATALGGPWIAGWGNTSTTGDVFPDTAKQANIPLASDATCDATQPIGSGFDATYMICGGVLDTDPDAVVTNGKDTCQGDSGGPLYVYDGGGNAFVAGVTSWGYGCASEQYGYYSRVGTYSPWILSIGNAADGPGGITDVTGVTVSGETASRATISWTAPVAPPAPTDYYVYLRSGGVDQYITSTTGTSVDLQGMDASTNYTFVVRSFNGDGLDQASMGGESTGATASVTTTGDASRPTRPGRPSKASSKRTRITIRWGASTDDWEVSKYEVWMAKGNAGFRRVKVDTSPGSRRFTKRSLKPGTYYRFKVRAIDAAGKKSVYSRSRTIKTKG